MLYNKTRQKAIIQKTRKAQNSWQCFKGLMFEKKKRFDYGLIFDFKREARIGASIHMLFVFFPIDLVFMDSEKKVVDIKQNIRPFSLNYTPKKKARFLAELPVKAAGEININDEMEW